MRESAVYQEILQEGLQEGLQKGRQEGLLEGKVKNNSPTYKIRVNDRRNCRGIRS